MPTTDTDLTQLVINVGTKAQIEAGISGGTITGDMLSITTDGANYLTTDDVKSTYSSTGTEPVNGTAVASALSTLSIPTETTISNWGFTKNTGTVTSVNNTSPDGNGNVSLTIPSTASEVGALPDTTKYGAALSLTSGTLQLLDQDGNNLGSSVTVPDASNFANKNLSNLTASSTPNIDGQWGGSQFNMINSDTTLSAQTTYDYSLSNYLPDDGYNYEVLFTCEGKTGSSSGNVAEIGVGSSFVDVGVYRVSKTTTRTSSTVDWAGCGIMPIGTNRTISIRQIASVACVCAHFRCLAYRRIGTNS